MNTFTKILLSASICSTVVAGAIAPSISAAAPSPSNTVAASTTAKEKVKEGIKGAGGDSNQITIGSAIKSIIDIMLFALGAISVIMIVIGGIRYTTSNGDSNGIQGAKNTILYAIVGLVVAILAYAMVNFVVDNLVSGGGQSTPTAQYNYV